jgi:hypothetical protein
VQTYPVLGAVIVGAFTPARSRSPFNRGRLVVRPQVGAEIVRVQSYEGCYFTPGALLTQEDWHELLDSGHALSLKGQPLRSGYALWVLRENFPRLDRALRDLRASGILVHAYRDAGDLFCLVDESLPAAEALRAEWRQEALDRALFFGRSGNADQALLEAHTAQAVCPHLEAETVAVLAYAHQIAHRWAAADGLLSMALRSRGPDFAREVLRLLDLMR